MKLFKSKEYHSALSNLKKINALESTMQTLSDKELKAKTQEFKDRLKKGETLDDVKNEAFAVVREAVLRVHKKRLFDVQIIGGLILHSGTVAEMRTGEGKTLTSIAPAYLNSLDGKGVIICTVNEYLTERDAEETGQVHAFLGVSVGVNKKDSTPLEKQEAYSKDITYSIHSEIGFDYLRDNMVKRIEEKCQRPFNFAIVDEVDSILIDEARTPLIITGGEQSSSQVYMRANTFVKTLKEEDYEIDPESKSISLTDSGADKAAKFFGISSIYDLSNSELIHRVQNALRAIKIMSAGVEYIVRENKILLIDAFTGRIMDGRSYSDGLHQAIQAKENVEIEPETKTLATITYQNLFRMFPKLSGMTGTAKTEEDEFLDIYNMRVAQVPTNEPVIRIDHPDVIFVSMEAKYKAVIKEIKERHAKGQPMLIGTEELSESEKLSKLLKKEGIKHQVLNAKQNEKEAEIIAKAGEFNSVTIATNMAGRGTDIKPSQKSLDVGGLYVIGTNKAESRRIDNQLKGRAGRQGDPGESKFFLSFDDNLISRFSNQEKLKKSFASFKDKPLTGKTIRKVMERAQRKIEGFNYDARKNVLQYDDVIRQQRDLIYKQRDIIISHKDLINVINAMAKSVAKDVVVFKHFLRKDRSIDIDKLVKSLNAVWFSQVDFKLNSKKLNGLTQDEIIESLQKDLVETYALMRERIIENFDEDFLHTFEREIVLRTFDQNWQVHINQMSKLRSSSSLASYAQKNPYQVYVEKGTELFNELTKRISHNTIKVLMSNTFAKQKVDKTQEVLEKIVSPFVEK